MLFNWNIIY